MWRYLWREKWLLKRVCILQVIVAKQTNKVIFVHILAKCNVFKVFYVREKYAHFNVGPLLYNLCVRTMYCAPMQRQVIIKTTLQTDVEVARNGHIYAKKRKCL